MNRFINPAKNTRLMASTIVIWMLTHTVVFPVKTLVRMSTNSGITSAVKGPLGIILMLVITLILAGLTVAASVSGDLTAAAVSAAGLVVIILILMMVAAIK